MNDDIDGLLDRLDRLRRAQADAEARLEGLTEDEAAKVTDAYRTAVSLLNDYRERATGTGDFTGYVEFRSKFSHHVEGLSEDFPRREVFEEALDRTERRRLSERDFEHAVAALDPAGAIVTALDELQSTRRKVAKVRKSLVDERTELVDRRAYLQDLADVQPRALDAPIEELRTPVERYNERIEDAHREFLSQTPARDVLAIYRRLSYFSLLDIDSPPEPLETFLTSHPAGGEPISTIRDYLRYSRSKLSHYVDDPGHFTGVVAPHSPYLESLTPEPFRLDWPPPEWSQLRWKLDELIKAANRFADESAIEPLRELHALGGEGERYHHLRSAARLREELDDEARELVLSGEVHTELEAVEQSIEAIDAALERRS